MSHSFFFLTFRLHVFTPIMKLTAIFLILMTTTGLHAQWAGTYYGTANGDPVVMTLQEDGTYVSGNMKDSYQYFDIEGTVTDQRFTGTASENSLNVVFDLNATRTGNRLDCILSIIVNGNKSETSFTVQKESETMEESPTPVTAIPTEIPFPSDAQFPAALSGRWIQNESYNSGSGDNFMGANFSQSMTFHSDGTLSEGASSASMSGSNYSNQSSGAGSGKIDGIGWYAKQNNLYLIVFNNGNWTSVLLGTWYAENNHLLITGTNGEKILLSR